MDIIHLVKSILDSEDFETIEYHPKLISDIETFFEKNQNDAEKFVELLVARLRILENIGPLALQNSNFESLKQAKGLFRIKLKTSNRNFRIIYSYKNNGEILLHCFYERGGKSRTNYKRAIQTAQKRYEEIMKEE